jgi:hypothetical protein
MVFQTESNFVKIMKKTEPKRQQQKPRAKPRKTKSKKGKSKKNIVIKDRVSKKPKLTLKEKGKIQNIYIIKQTRKLKNKPKPKILPTNIGTFSPNIPIGGFTNLTNDENVKNNIIDNYVRQNPVIQRRPRGQTQAQQQNQRQANDILAREQAIRNAEAIDRVNQRLENEDRRINELQRRIGRQSVVVGGTQGLPIRTISSIVKERRDQDLARAEALRTQQQEEYRRRMRADPYTNTPLQEPEPQAHFRALGTINELERDRQVERTTGADNLQLDRIVAGGDRSLRQRFSNIFRRKPEGRRADLGQTHNYPANRRPTDSQVQNTIRQFEDLSNPEREVGNLLGGEGEGRPTFQEQEPQP